MFYVPLELKKRRGGGGQKFRQNNRSMNRHGNFKDRKFRQSNRDMNGGGHREDRRGQRDGHRGQFHGGFGRGRFGGASSSRDSYRK